MKKLVSAFIGVVLSLSAARGQIGIPVGATGGGGGSGTVTSVATGCGATGGPITTTGTISAQVLTRANAATTDTIVANDCGNFVTETNASPVAVTLPQATGSFANGYFTRITNLGAGLVTITPTTSNINGFSSVTLATSQSVDLASNGTNYVGVFAGPGTVTSASVTTANGVSASVATATTTPAFTFTLGAITPSSVNGNTITTGTGTLTLAAGKALTDTSAIGASVLLGATGGGFTALAGNSCTNQAGVSISAAGVLGCASITNSFLTAGSFPSITGVGTLTAGTLSTGVVVGGVTMTLGSDATGDMYYRNVSGVLTRLPVCTGTNVVGASGGVPACVAQSGGGGSPGGSTTQVQYNNAGAFGGISGVTTNGTTLTHASGALILSGSGSGSSILNAPATGGGTATLFAGTDTIAGLGTIQTFSAAQTFSALATFSAAGAASTPGMTISGAPFTGGTATTNFPQLYLNSGAAVTSFVTTGTVLGINAPSGFGGDFFDTHVNGGASIISMQAASATAGTIINASSTPGSGSLLSIRNTSANAAAVGVLNFGNNTANAEWTVNVFSSANTPANGFSILGTNVATTGIAGSFAIAPGTTATGTGGSINLTAGLATGAGIGGSINLTLGTTSGGTAGSLSIANLPQSAAAQSGTVCFNTSGNVVTYDATLGCLASLEELKDIHGPITNALAKVVAFKPFWFTPINRSAGSDFAEQPGFGAHQIEAIDRRLVGYDVNGNLRGVRYMEMTAVLAAAIAEQQAEIESLKRRVH